MKEIFELLDIMRALRDPHTGCPWDRRQTLDTVLAYTMEEAYELAEAIQDNDIDSLKEELGDLLFHIIFYSQIAEESDQFSFTEVVKQLNDKLRRRHPHVFDSSSAGKVSIQEGDWEKMKTHERADKHQRNAGLLDDISGTIPALIYATKLQKRAASVEFDWTEIKPVLDKIEEEISEIRAELNGRADNSAIKEEVGDLLFACVNFARHVNVDSETALMSTNRKFINRFRYIESRLAQRNKSLTNATLDEMEALWQESKQQPISGD